jgi:CCR4-NOT complex subunit CAF16
MSSVAIEVRELSFGYRGEPRRVLDRVSLTVERGRRVLLVGANGAGKSTLLRVLAGKHLVAPDVVRVLGRAAFHDPELAGRVEMLGGRFPFDVDITVDEILARRDDIDRTRGTTLCEVLGVDRGWHMHAVSDGQRRRVQILLGLLRPRDVLLLDEITTDLDLIARFDLLAFLRVESETRGTTIVYATHIFDTLEAWATDVIYMVDGRVALVAGIADIHELAAAPLVRVVEGWLRRDRVGGTAS